MIPIVSIVGKSDSGKTTLMEKLIPELKNRGYRVATIKHHIHGFEIDKEGKDTWRHTKAGADEVVISSPNKLAIIKVVDKEYTLDKIGSSIIKDVDIILTEGYKKGDKPKIEVFRSEVHKELLCTDEDNLIAIVSDRRFDRGVPCFDINDIKGLADLLEKTFLKKIK
ncbi:MAG TPA: molybdopterin-guanine dinucleotide biosynthesis protein B [Nitrospinota bacterium]|nr:molybdopterin-guanine dinucleotide biosynthesis protein B [Nitrospinota bacterium]